MSMKTFYRLQEEYWRTQNMFHKKQVIKIQAVFRGYLGRKKTKVLIKDNAALVR